MNAYAVKLRACYYQIQTESKALTVIPRTILTGPGMTTLLSYQGFPSHQLSACGVAPGPWNQVSVENIPQLQGAGFAYWLLRHNKIKLDLRVRAFIDPSLAVSDTSLFHHFPTTQRFLLVVARSLESKFNAEDCGDLMNELIPFKASTRDLLINSDMEWSEYMRNKPPHILHWQYVTIQFKQEDRIGGGQSANCAYWPMQTFDVSIPAISIDPWAANPMDVRVYQTKPTAKLAREQYFSTPGNYVFGLSQPATSYFPTAIGVMPIGHNPHAWQTIVETLPSPNPQKMAQAYRFETDISMCAWSDYTIFKSLDYRLAPISEYSTVTDNGANGATFGTEVNPIEIETSGP